MKKTRTFTFMPGDDNPIARAYTLFRAHTREIAERVKTNPRCHKCFTVGFIRHGGEWTVCHGCDGCAEMNDFIHAARELFDDERNAKGVKHG